MTKATATAIFRTDLTATAKGDSKAAPDWVELFPAGPALNARDGRKWTANPKAVLEAFAANKAPLPIDYEHGQDILATKGQEAPSAGWIVALEDRAGAVWGKVEWTARAARMIAEREYRFLSPAFNHTREGLITRLQGAGLVNRPALEMTALSRAELTEEEDHSMKAITKALGLAEDADEKAILDALAARDADRAAICTALKLDPEKADKAAIVAAIAKAGEETPASTARANPDAAELTAVTAQLKDTQAALAALQKKDADRDIDAELDRATAAGKITPATRAEYRALCQAEGGLERFRALAKGLPVIATPTALDRKASETAEEAETDPVELAARARKYKNEQEAAGRVITISEAVAHVKEQK